MINLGRNRVDCQQEREAHMVVQAHNVQSGLQVYKKKKKKKKKAGDDHLGAEEGRLSTGKRETPDRTGKRDMNDGLKRDMNGGLCSGGLMRLERVK